MFQRTITHCKTTADANLAELSSPYHDVTGAGIAKRRTLTAPEAEECSRKCKTKELRSQKAIEDLS